MRNMTEYPVACIDDDEQFLRSLAVSLPDKVAPLCEQFECVFEFVASPEELFGLLAGQPEPLPLAMVIADQMMPGMCGIDLIEKLKADNPDLVCILLTGHGGLESAKYAINRRLLDQYVAKPVEDLQEFGALVANLLQRHHLKLQERQRTIELDQTVERLRLSNEKITAMLAAAEEIAALSKGLKNLDFDDVVALVLREIPKIFRAGWGVLCFPQDGCPSGLVGRHNCPCPEPALLARVDLAEPQPLSRIACEEVPAVCSKLGGQSPDIVIPLTISGCTRQSGDALGQWRGYLCMCHVDDAVRASTELAQYKGGLVRDVLSANLTNARLYQQARRDSQIDPLTGVNTRRVLEERLVDEHGRAQRYGHSFCVAMVDTDHFKDVNDTAGHVTGDQVLRELTGILVRELRATDVLARYGGDEFVVLMPETKLGDAVAVAERMRHKVQARLKADGGPLTISCGLAEWSGAPGESGTDVLRRADGALYAAKRAGRDRVEVAALSRAR